jgi:hypothetical protein
MSAVEPSVSDPVQPSQRFAFIRRPAFLLTLITLFGLILRLTRLSRPELWLDEAAVFRRTCGSLAELLDQLTRCGFTPLHYLLYWAIDRVATMTPFMMRLPTGLAGAAMVPAMYWLSVQIVASKRTALVVAMFTACSAYMLNYSRDAKMYVECWLFAALGTACLLWWLRTRLRIAWHCWVISGLCMLGLHATGAIVLGIQAIIYLTHPKLHWKTAIFFVVGLAVIVAPVAIYYQKFNRYHQRIEQDWSVSGLDWIDGANGERETPQLLGVTATHFLFAWELPALMGRIQVDPRLLSAGKTIALFMAAVLAAGLLPWRRRWTEPIGWRGLLWIGAWMTIPVYGLYCVSNPDSAPPWRWLTSIVAAYPYWSGGVVLAIVASFFFPAVSWRQRISHVLVPAAVTGMLLALCAGVYAVAPVQEGSLWMPRYVGVIWPAFAIAVGVLLMRLPTPQIRFAAVVLVLSMNLLQYVVRVFVRVEPPTGLIAQDILASRGADETVRTYYGVPDFGLFGQHTDYFTPSGLYYLFMLSNTPVEPSQINARFESDFPIWRLRGLAQFTLPREVREHPRLKRVIVWDGATPRRAGELGDDDPLLEAIAPQWKRVSDEQFRVIDRWTWGERLLVRRRVYQRD